MRYRDSISLVYLLFYAVHRKLINWEAVMCVLIDTYHL